MKYYSVAFWLAIVFSGNPLVVQAQESVEFPAPQEEHKWLQQFVGDWTSESKAMMGPEETMECQGTMKSRPLGGFWVINETQGDMSGMTINALQCLGYDPAKKKYVGTWIDSVTSHIWHYEGSVDDSGKKIILEAEGPNFMADGKMTKFRDAYEFKSPDHIAMSSEMQGEDGKWTTIMTGDFRRKK